MSTGFVDWAIMKVKKNVNREEHSIAFLWFRGMVVTVEVFSSTSKSTSVDVIHFAIEMRKQFFGEIENEFKTQFLGSPFLVEQSVKLFFSWSFKKMVWKSKKDPKRKYSA